MAEPQHNATPDVVIEPMEFDDLEQVLEIEHESFMTPWSPDLFINEFSNPRSCKFVALNTSSASRRLVGYMIYWEVTVDEFHLMSIATRPPLRKTGVAQKLLDTMIGHIVGNGGGRILLEARVTNEAAQKLYLKNGFTPLALRKNYYYDTGEDAILMERIVKP